MSSEIWEFSAPGWYDFNAPEWRPPVDDYFDPRRKEEDDFYYPEEIVDDMNNDNSENINPLLGSAMKAGVNLVSKSPHGLLPKHIGTGQAENMTDAKVSVCSPILTHSIPSSQIETSSPRGNGIGALTSTKTPNLMNCAPLKSLMTPSTEGKRTYNLRSTTVKRRSDKTPAAKQHLVVEVQATLSPLGSVPEAPAFKHSVSNSVPVTETSRTSLQNNLIMSDSPLDYDCQSPIFGTDANEVRLDRISFSGRMSFSSHHSLNGLSGQQTKGTPQSVCSVSSTSSGASARADAAERSVMLRKGAEDADLAIKEAMMAAKMARLSAGSRTSVASFARSQPDISVPAQSTVVPTPLTEDKANEIFISVLPSAPSVKRSVSSKAPTAAMRVPLVPSEARQQQNPGSAESVDIQKPELDSIAVLSTKMKNISLSKPQEPTEVPLRSRSITKPSVPSHFVQKRSVSATRSDLPSREQVVRAASREKARVTQPEPSQSLKEDPSRTDSTTGTAKVSSWMRPTAASSSRSNSIERTISGAVETVKGLFRSLSRPKTAEAPVPVEKQTKEQHSISGVVEVIPSASTAERGPTHSYLRNTESSVAHAHLPVKMKTNTQVSAPSSTPLSSITKNCSGEATLSKESVQKQLHGGKGPHYLLPTSAAVAAADDALLQLIERRKEEERLRKLAIKQKQMEMRERLHKEAQRLHNWEKESLEQQRLRERERERSLSLQRELMREKERERAALRQSQQAPTIQNSSREKERERSWSRGSASRPPTAGAASEHGAEIPRYMLPTTSANFHRGRSISRGSENESESRANSRASSRSNSRASRTIAVSPKLMTRLRSIERSQK